MPKIAKWIADTLENLLDDKIPIMKVVNTQNINRNIKKISLKGNISDVENQPGYAVAIRVSDTEYRNYTASYIDISKGILEIIIHLHTKGIGNNFLDSLSVGDRIRVSVPRGKKMYEPLLLKAKFYGDETSLGFALAMQAALADTDQSIQFYFELDQENFKVPDLLGLENYTVFAKSRIFQDPDLPNRLSVLEIQEKTAINYILTGNGISLQNIRKSLKKAQVKGKIFAQAYWIEGKTGI